MANAFGFPYDSPYATQLLLMKSIVSAINDQKIAFFESPTGTVNEYLSESMVIVLRGKRYACCAPLCTGCT